MNKRISTILTMAGAIILAVVISQPAFAGHQWILLHHEDQGRGQPTFDQCMPIEAWDGHADHIGDSYQGPYDNNECLPSTPTLAPTEVPTDEPTPTETEEPQPTPTEDPGCEEDCEPTDEPGPTPIDPSPVPTEGPGPTDTPVVPDRLPETGDGLSTETWPCWGTNVYCAHNGVDGSIGETWVFYYEGETILFDGQTYVVEARLRVPADQVSILDNAADYDLVLITCTNYVNGVWLERVVIFAELFQ